jgi:hypothetical protein
LRIAPPDLRPRTATVRATLIIPRYQAVDAALYQTAQVFRYAGNALVVLGAVLDLESIVTASNPLRRSTAAISAWAMALIGARAAGSMGAAAGGFVEPRYWHRCWWPGVWHRRRHHRRLGGRKSRRGGL